MIKMVMFDMDNTINNWGSEIYAKQVAEESGASMAKVEKFISPLADLMDEAKITLKQFECSTAIKFNIQRSRIGYYNCYKRNVKFNQRMIRILKRLKKKYLTALMTNSDRCRYGYTAKAMDFSLFDYRFVSGYTHVRKPRLNSYKLVFERTGLKPDEIVFIDNNAKNVAAARKIGIKAIHYVNVAGLVGQLNRLGIM